MARKRFEITNDIGSAAHMPDHLVGRGSVMDGFTERTMIKHPEGGEVVSAEQFYGHAAIAVEVAESTLEPTPESPDPTPESPESPESPTQPLEDSFARQRSMREQLQV